MQSFDTLTLALIATLLLMVVRQRTTNGWLLLCAAATTASLVAHLLFEGPRWQMVPAYVLIAATFAVLTVRMQRGTTPSKPTLLKRIGHWSGSVLAIALLCATALLSYAFPVFELPTPGGNFAIGTAQWHITDSDRIETYSSDTSDRRQLMLRIWYPADSVHGYERAKYWKHADVRSAAVTAATPLPSFTFTHLRNVQANSYWNAPISKSKPTFPVVLYSHGTGVGWESANTVLAESLASNGYIVVGINHTYIGSISVFPNGTTILHHAQTAAAMSEPPPQEVKDLQSKLLTSTVWQEHIDYYQHAMSLMPPAALKAVGKALDNQVADHTSVLDHIQQAQSAGASAEPLAQHMNLARVGIVGMSLGGSAAFETCVARSQCAAGVNLDGFHPRHIGLPSHETPFLYVNRFENLLFQSNYSISSAPAYAVNIADVTHFNFFDFSIMSPLYQRMGVLGPIDGYRALEVTGASVLAFFDIYLKGQHPNSWQARLAPYPEASLTQRNATTQTTPGAKASL